MLSELSWQIPCSLFLIWNFLTHPAYILHSSGLHASSQFFDPSFRVQWFIQSLLQAAVSRASGMTFPESLLVWFFFFLLTHWHSSYHHILPSVFFFESLFHSSHIFSCLWNISWLFSLAFSTILCVCSSPILCLSATSLFQLHSGPLLVLFWLLIVLIWRVIHGRPVVVEKWCWGRDQGSELEPPKAWISALWPNTIPYGLSLFWKSWDGQFQAKPCRLTALCTHGRLPLPLAEESNWQTTWAFLLSTILEFGQQRKAGVDQLTQIVDQKPNGNPTSNGATGVACKH